MIMESQIRVQLLRKVEGLTPVKLRRWEKLVWWAGNGKRAFFFMSTCRGQLETPSNVESFKSSSCSLCSTLILVSSAQLPSHNRQDGQLSSDNGGDNGNSYIPHCQTLPEVTVDWLLVPPKLAKRKADTTMFSSFQFFDLAFRHIECAAYLKHIAVEL